MTRYQITKVVIDPGHGGKDPGAVGKRSKEKDIVLSIALKLGNYIKTNFPGIKIIYTRSKDEFIELHRRLRLPTKTRPIFLFPFTATQAKNTNHTEPRPS